MPVGGGGGGIYGQAWRLQPNPPYDSPYGGGPADSSSDAAPFNTLNALILSYIDQALGSVVPSNTSGSNVATNPASLSVTASDGLGTFTFGATANFTIDGQVVAGSFSTTDSATFTYTFHEVGYTPDGNQFTLDDKGGATLNVHADNGNASTHSLTNTLTGSDSYALTQNLAQSDTIGTSFSTGETDTDTIAGSDSFSMTETQFETVNTTGSVTAGSDSYVFAESGTDSSTNSDYGTDTYSSGYFQTSDADLLTESDSEGHTLTASGTDSLSAGGFIPSGSDCFTWGESDAGTSSQSAVSDWVFSENLGTLFYLSTPSWSSDAESESTSESSGETGSELFTNVPGTFFSWTETLGYAENSQDSGWSSATESDLIASWVPSGTYADVEFDADFPSTTFSDNDDGNVATTLTDTGSQTLSSSIITAASSTFSWSNHETDTETNSESTTESGTLSQTEPQSTGLETDIDFETATESDGGVDTETDTEVSSETDSGNESIGTYGLAWSGADTITAGGSTSDSDTSTESAADTGTDTAIEISDDVADDAPATSVESDVLTDLSNSSETDTDTSTIISDTSTLAARGRRSGPRRKLDRDRLKFRQLRDLGRHDGPRSGNCLRHNGRRSRHRLLLRRQHRPCQQQQHGKRYRDRHRDRHRHRRHRRHSNRRQSNEQHRG